VSAFSRFQLRTYSSAEETDRSYEAATEAASDASAASDVASNTRTNNNRSSEDPEARARSVYVGNVYFDITEVQLKELASQYGGVEEVKLMKDIRGFSRG
jgi:RNA recognition motif-containing protein